MALKDELTSYRKENSGKRSPAYMIFSNEARDEIARVRPSNIDDLYAIKGVRKDFVLKHGSNVLEIIRKYE